MHQRTSFPFPRRKSWTRLLLGQQRRWWEDGEQEGEEGGGMGEERREEEEGQLWETAEESRLHTVTERKVVKGGSK